MHVVTLSKRLPLSISPLDAYKRLTNNGLNKNTILLETAEAGTHAQQKSVIAVSSAVKIMAKNSEVILTALNVNGEAFLDGFDYSDLSDFSITRNENRVMLSLNPANSSLDEEVRLSEPSVLDVLKIVKKQVKSNSKEDNVSSCLLGVFSYDLVDQFESLPPINKIDEDYIFYLVDQLLVQTEHNHSAQIIVKGFAKNSGNEVHLGLEIEKLEAKLKQEAANSVVNIQTSPSKLNISDDEFKEQVKKVKKHIVDGDVFQVVLSRHYQVACDSALASYESLRKSNPSPYMYYLNFEDKQLFGASPESCLKITENKEVSLYPIAGTRKRAITNGEINYDRDAQIEFELIDDEKESAEHMMLVDLARNDIARVVEIGSRRITQLKRVVKYSHVMHMVSEVKGQLKPDLDPLDAYRACANMGTLTGAPKIKAMQIIRQYEKEPRGFYGGAVTIMNANDEFDSAIVIRSALVRNQVATITAGAGVVFDSIPTNEAIETDNKARAVINACNVSSTIKEEIK